jgi:hypothetical protein
MDRLINDVFSDNQCLIFFNFKIGHSKIYNGGTRYQYLRRR